MPTIFNNYNLKAVRKIFAAVDQNKILAYCDLHNLQRPERPSDLCLEYEDDAFYLCRVRTGFAVRILEINDNIMGVEIPAEGWQLKKYRNTENTK